VDEALVLGLVLGMVVVIVALCIWALRKRYAASLLHDV